MNKKVIFVVKAILFIAVAIYISFTFQKSLGNLVVKSGISWFWGSIILRIITCIAFSRGIQLLIKSTNLKLNTILVVLIGLILGFGVSFIGEPIYNTDYGTFGNNERKLNVNTLTNITGGSFNLNGKSAVVSFFTSDCPHCKALSNKLGFLNKNGLSPQIISIFPGNKEDTDRFLKENNGDSFIHHRISDHDFIMEHTGGSFPSIFLVNKNAETISQWSGDELNYSALDLIKSFK
jgi:hypothetical protein